MLEPLVIQCEGLHSTEVSMLRARVDLVLRNVEIRARYDELRRAGTPAFQAKALLSDTYSLSTDAIDAILWPRHRPNPHPGR